MHVTKFGKAAFKLGAEFRVAARPQRGCNLPGSGSWAHWRSRLPAGATARGQPRLELETAAQTAGREQAAEGRTWQPDRPDFNGGARATQWQVAQPTPISTRVRGAGKAELPSCARPWCQTRLHGPEPFLADMHNLAGTALCATVVKPSTVHSAAQLGCPSWGSARRWQTSAAVRKAQAC
jgi:hypothetical protein